MGMLSESQETYCSKFQEISKSENLEDEIKSIRLRLSQMRLKLNNAKECLPSSQLEIFKDDLLEIKQNYWLNLHVKTRQSIDHKLNLIKGKLNNNNDCLKKCENNKKSIRNNATVETKKVYDTRSKVKIGCPKQSETIEKKSTFKSKKLKVDNTNLKPKNLDGKRKKQSIKYNASFNQVHNFEEPYKTLLSNTFPRENISSGFDYKKILPNTQPISKTNFFGNILSDIEQTNSEVQKDYYNDELSKLNTSSSAENYNPDQKNNIKETIFCLTEQHCKKLARLLKLNENFLINQIHNVIENDEIDEFDDVSVIGPSQSPVNYKVWKNQRINRTKVSLNTELEHFDNYFVDNIDFDL